MACVDTMPGTSTDTSAGFERVHYFPRQLLTADDMRIEQEYFRDKQRRHNRFLHGWGVVCGLEVTHDAAKGPLAVLICPGYALGPCGDEIYVPESIPLDLSDCIRKPADPCLKKGEVFAPQTGMPSAIVVSIRYAECPTRPLRTLPAGCGCDETSCEYSRIRDGFDLRCRPKGSVFPQKLPATICEIEKDRSRTLPPWPDPPSDPWVDLAMVTLTAEETDPYTLDATTIDNGFRRILYSSAMIQHQLIACCCDVKK
jgi:hypothetical protein